jgi:glucose-1-phosphate adenylyltransferase
VRKQQPELLAVNPREFLILSGDHLYRMDYGAFIEAHREAGADISVAVLPVSRAEASRFGILETDSARRIINFHEKPTDPRLLDSLATYPDPQRPCLGSMGVYLFRAEVLYSLLEEEAGSDFGKHILPASLKRWRVFAYPFEGYWEDIGTIRSFYEANLALAASEPAFSFHDAERPIYTHPRFLPPSRVDQDCILRDVLLADGCEVVRSQIYESIVGVRSRIGPAARLSRTVMMGADQYETDSEKAAHRAAGLPPIGVGQGCVIEGAIIDKNARIGDDVVIRHIPDRPDMETENYVARDGLIIVMKNGVVPNGSVI